jgi:ankyrin repeat protein
MLARGYEIQGEPADKFFVVNSAVRTRNPEIVRLVLEHGADPREYDSWDNRFGRMYAMAEAIRDGSPVEIVHLLMAAGVRADEHGVRGMTWLQAAVYEENAEVLKLFAESDADINACCDLGNTALHSAAERGDVPAIEVLVRHGADVNRQNKEGYTPLHAAGAFDKVDAVLKLLARGANPNLANSRGNTPMHDAAGGYGYKSNQTSKRILLALLRHGGDRHLENNAGRTPLQLAEQRGFSDFPKERARSSGRGR